MTSRIKTVLLSLPFSVFLFACIQPNKEIASSHVATKPNEVIYGYELKSTTILINVLSNGCTHEKDFVVTSKKEHDTYTLSIERLKQDNCRRRPFLAQVELSHDIKNCDHHCKIKLANQVLDKTSFNGEIQRH